MLVLYAPKKPKIKKKYIILALSCLFYMLQKSQKLKKYILF